MRLKQCNRLWLGVIFELEVLVLELIHGICQIWHSEHILWFIPWFCYLNPASVWVFISNEKHPNFEQLSGGEFWQFDLFQLRHLITSVIFSALEFGLGFLLDDLPTANGPGKVRKRVADTFSVALSRVFYWFLFEIQSWKYQIPGFTIFASRRLRNQAPVVVLTTEMKI